MKSYGSRQLLSQDFNLCFASKSEDKKVIAKHGYFTHAEQKFCETLLFESHFDCNSISSWKTCLLSKSAHLVSRRTRLWATSKQKHILSRSSGSHDVKASDVCRISIGH